MCCSDGLQGDAAASLETIQETAVALNETVRGPVKAIPSWDRKGRLEYQKQTQAEQRVLGKSMLTSGSWQASSNLHPMLCSHCAA